MSYRGRLAPTPSGYLHLGHASTFLQAHRRCREREGVLVLRQEDLDTARCKPEFARAAEEDLRWFGLDWEEGPDVGGPYGPYVQSERQPFYTRALQTLVERKLVYACTCSRKDIQNAPHQGDEEPIYPGTCRGGLEPPKRGHYSWRFRVPDGQVVEFHDNHLGPQRFVAGQHFGDFVVWRGGPSYQLAVVVDDAAMQITEVVRGADLLLSTARQLLLYRALDLRSPEFFHTDLLTDDAGVRLAKRHDALSLRKLREEGRSAADIMASVAVR